MVKWLRTCTSTRLLQREVIQREAIKNGAWVTALGLGLRGLVGTGGWGALGPDYFMNSTLDSAHSLRKPSSAGRKNAARLIVRGTRRAAIKAPLRTAPPVAGLRRVFRATTASCSNGFLRERAESAPPLMNNPGPSEARRRGRREKSRSRERCGRGEGHSDAGRRPSCRSLRGR